MTPPVWLDAAGRSPDPGLLDLWPRGRADAVPGRASPAARMGAAADAVHPDWCGCTTEYLPVPVGDGWWHLVPIWEPDQTANPLRRYEPPAPR